MGVLRERVVGIIGGAPPGVNGLVQPLGILATGFGK
jgi:hypothetical protein